MSVPSTTPIVNTSPSLLFESSNQRKQQIGPTVSPLHNIVIQSSPSSSIKGVTAAASSASPTGLGNPLSPILEGSPKNARTPMSGIHVYRPPTALTPLTPRALIPPPQFSPSPIPSDHSSSLSLRDLTISPFSVTESVQNSSQTENKDQIEQIPQDSFLERNWRVVAVAIAALVVLLSLGGVAIAMTCGLLYFGIYAASIVTINLIAGLILYANQKTDAAISELPFPG